MFCRNVLNQRLPHITKTRHQTPKQLTTSPSWFISFFSILTPTYFALLYFFGHTLTFVSQLHMFHTTIKWTEDTEEQHENGAHISIYWRSFKFSFSFELTPNGHTTKVPKSDNTLGDVFSHDDGSLKQRKEMLNILILTRNLLITIFNNGS